MSIFYRREKKREQLFLKEMHLKVCNLKLATILSPEFTEEEYILTFKECFPHIWDEIVFFCSRKKSDFFRRKKRNKRAVPFYTPEQYLIHHVQLKQLKPLELTDDARFRNKNEIVRQGKLKQQQRNEKLRKNLVYVQEVCPSYVNRLIRAYYNTRRKQTLNVNVRYLMILEASHFKCAETVSFLHQINSCEKNRHLQLTAFYALQRMGERPWLSKKRKGKKKLSHVKSIDLLKNPTELLNMMSQYLDQIYPMFDIFLSHSSRDENELLRIKSILNSQGYIVYIDWVNDREMLNRANQNHNTWDVLYKRMDQSVRLMYVMTDNCINSECTKREVNYFKAAKKPVYVYQPTQITLNIPDYLTGCLKVDDINKLNLKD